MPVVMIPELLRSHYSLICIMYDGDFCNNIAAAYTPQLDPATTGSLGMDHYDEGWKLLQATDNGKPRQMACIGISA